jgi:hypothetical protein
MDTMRGTLPMKLTPDIEAAIAEYTAGMKAARREYRNHPIEFNKRIYCVDCCYIIGTTRGCATCTHSRSLRRRRAGAA